MCLYVSRAKLNEVQPKLSAGSEPPSVSWWRLTLLVRLQVDSPTGFARWPSRPRRMKVSPLFGHSKAVGRAERFLGRRRRLAARKVEPITRPPPTAGRPTVPAEPSGIIPAGTVASDGQLGERVGGRGRVARPPASSPAPSSIQFVQHRPVGAAWLEGSTTHPQVAHPESVRRGVVENNAARAWLALD